MQKCCLSALKVLALFRLRHTHVRKDTRLSLHIRIPDRGSLGTRLTVLHRWYHVASFPGSSLCRREPGNEVSTTQIATVVIEVGPSYPLSRTHFSQHQVSSAALGWPGDGHCYLVQKLYTNGGNNI